MLFVLFTSITLFVAVFGIKFTPEVPDILEYHNKRVWVWLNSKSSCFGSEADVIAFKDHLLSEYDCIDFNPERTTIYKHVISTSPHEDVWSLWLELDDWNFNCLDNNISLPSNVEEECVSKVYFEPLYQMEQSCVDQSTGSQLWSLDRMDGIINNIYRYEGFSASQSANVAAIVLDGGVDETHVEFVDNSPESLFIGTPAPTMTYDHGTHVSGTVLGTTCGGSRNGKLYWYPVCQIGNSCAWSTIEGGYNAAVAKMRADPNTLFVINYSVGGSKSPVTTPQYDAWGVEIEAEGNFWVTSAGNSASDACNFSPAYSEKAITVGSFSSSGAPTTWFTNYGVCVDTWGPGENVYSATPGGGYGTASGTSMASPNIAALVINLLKNDPSMSRSDIDSYLENTATTRTLTNVPSSWSGNHRYPIYTC